MTKVLIIAYYFPPLAGGGVHRIVRLTVYLAQKGVTPIIITGNEKNNGRWSPKDKTLLKQFDKNLPLYRLEHPYQASNNRNRFSRWLGSSDAFSKWWASSAIKIGIDICEKHKPDLIFCTMGPYSSAISADFLSKKFSIPWVADLRDPWVFDDMEIYPTCFHQKTIKSQMLKYLSTASSIIMNTSEAAQTIKEAFTAISPQKITFITNGFDKNDFTKNKAISTSTKFRIVHTGTFHTDLGFRVKKRYFIYRLMGSIRKGLNILTRSHFYLLNALENLFTNVPQIKNDIEIIFAGVYTKSDIELVRKSPIYSHINFTGYISHNETIEYIKSSDLLFLPMYNLSKGLKSLIIPGKTYEYIASGIPILAAVPDGDLKELIIRSQTGFVCKPDDIIAMKDIILKVYKGWQNSEAVIKPNWDVINNYEGDFLANKIFEELIKVVNA